MFTIMFDHAEDDPDCKISVLEVNQMPLYGPERMMGMDDALPGGDGNVLEFRAYDDDDNLMIEGLLDDDPEAVNQVAALRWCESYAGCTRIDVLRGGEWCTEIG